MSQRRSSRSFRSAYPSNSGSGGLREKTSRFKRRPSHDEEKARRSPSPAYVPPNPNPSAYYFSANQITPQINDAQAAEPKAFVYDDDPVEKVRRNDNVHSGKALPVASPYYKSPLQDVPGPSDYERFHWRCEDMLGELSRLKFAFHTVGASGPCIQAIDEMILSFRDLRELFGKNTYSLYPQDARLKPMQTRSDAYLVKFSRSLERVADALGLAEIAFGDFRGVFYDDVMMYNLVCLKKRFKSEAKRTAPGRGVYIKPLPEDSKKNIQALIRDFLYRAVENLQKHFSNYCDKGVPVISSSQGMKTSRYLDLTTIATFLSGVTASMLQLSSDDTSGPVAIGVNTFLFSSLVFSIASAINSLLVMAWRKSYVREPNNFMPVWISACLNTGPMISLVISVAFFAVGICLFVFSSSQHIVTTVVTVSFAGFHTLCLLLLAIWLIFEKWKFRKVAGSVGQGLTGDSLSLAILDWIIYWPEKINSVVRPGGVIEPSYLEPSTREPYAVSYSANKPYEIWDGLANNFLPGTYSNAGGSTFSPPRDSRAGYGRVSSRSEEAAHVHSEVDSHYIDETVVGDYGRPNPTGIDYSEEGAMCQAAEHALHNEDKQYGDDIYERPATPESPRPIIMQAPPVDSLTYEAALFLPRNEDGDFEDVDSSSSESNESVKNYPYTLDPPPVIPLNFANFPPMPSSYAPTPMATSYSERVMVIPTNPPTYVVPPGSYVAYGTQPAIGPATQAGNFTVYNPNPPGHWETPAIPTAIPPTPVIPMHYSPYQGPRHDLPDIDIHIPEEPAMRHGGEEPVSGPRIRVIHRDEPHSDWRNNGYESARHDNRPMSRDSSNWRSHSGNAASWDQMHRQYTPAQPPQSTTQSDRLPYWYPRSSQRRTSTGSTQVRFGPPVFIPSRRASTDMQSGYSEARSTNTSLLGGSLTTEPEQIEETDNGNKGDHDGPAASRGRPFVTSGPSRLDVLQRRPRRTTSSSYYDARSQPSTRARTEDSNPSRSVSRHERVPRPPEDGSHEPPERRQSSQISQATGPPDPQNITDHNQPHVQSVMSTIEEATRSSMTVDSDHDSDSSERSARTAQETMPGTSSYI